MLLLKENGCLKNNKSRRVQWVILFIFLFCFVFLFLLLLVFFCFFVVVFFLGGGRLIYVCLVFFCREVLREINAAELVFFFFLKAETCKAIKILRLKKCTLNFIPTLNVFER